MNPVFSVAYLMPGFFEMEMSDGTRTIIDITERKAGYHEPA